MLVAVLCIILHIVDVHSISRWSQIGTSIIGAPHEGFGASLAINYDGSIVAVGSGYVNPYTFSQGESVSIWRHNCTAEWTQMGSRETLSSSTIALGSSLALNAEGNVLSFSGQQGINDRHVGTLKSVSIYFLSPF